MSTKVIFVKAKDFVDLASSSEEKETTNDGSTLPLHLFCGGLQMDSDEESSNPLFVLALWGLRKYISWNKKENKRRYAPSNLFLVYYYYKKKGHQTMSCWYSEVCLFCGKKGHLACCWKNQATCHKPNFFRE